MCGKPVKSIFMDRLLSNPIDAEPAYIRQLIVELVPGLMPN